MFLIFIEGIPFLENVDILVVSFDKSSSCFSTSATASWD